MLRFGGVLLVAFPFLLQFLVLAIDEFYFHRRRVLRKWERVGHPVDTFVYTLCFLPVLFMDSNYQNAKLVYFSLAAVSCLLITKDEWEHRELCTGSENWLHALLFILHPLCLTWLFAHWDGGNQNAVFVAGGLVVATLATGFYQTFYWNFGRDQQRIL